MPTKPTNPVFEKKFGLFVTITKNEQLRGCIGYIKPYKNLFDALVELSQAAAFNDTRFYPVDPSEFEHLDFEISLLSPLCELTDIYDFEIGKDGLYIQNPLGSGLLLPQVATKYGWNKETFLIEICRKAGIQKSYLTDKDTKLYKFSVVAIGN